MVAELTLGGTAEQWAQGEAERQRQADLVQTLIHAKSDGWERNRTGDTEAGRRTFVAHTANEPESITGSRTLAPPAGRRIIDTRIGKPSVFTGDQNTWCDWSFKLRSYVSVVTSNSAE